VNYWNEITRLDVRAEECSEHETQLSRTGMQVETRDAKSFGFFPSFLFFLAVLDFELRASCLLHRLHRHSPTEPLHQLALFFKAEET
jgi:hypothetical protein